jgi:hypothetical protein
MPVPAGFDSRDTVAANSSVTTTAAVTSISFTEQPRQLLFFGQPMVMAQKSGRCDLRVNEYAA